MKRNFKVLKAILFILVLAVIAVLALDVAGIIDIESGSSLKRKTNYITYSSFAEKLESKKINKAIIEEEKIIFFTDEGSFVTDNPKSGTLKERLLEAGALVTVKNGASVTSVLDVVFDIVFFGAAAFGVFKLIDYSRKTFRVVHNTGIRFDDIAGMDDVKHDMMFLVDVLKYPQKYEGKGLRPVKGVILEGTPGNGKTLFAKALAQEADVNFIATKGADFRAR